MAFHPRWSPDIDAEGPVRMTWAIEPGDGEGAPTRLVVTTAIFPGSRVEAEFPGGNAYIVSGLKTFLETGVPLAVAQALTGGAAESLRVASEGSRSPACT